MILLGKVRKKSQYFTFLHSVPKEDIYVSMIKTVHLSNEFLVGDIFTLRIYYLNKNTNIIKVL